MNDERTGKIVFGQPLTEIPDYLISWTKEHHIDLEAVIKTISSGNLPSCDFYHPQQRWAKLKLPFAIPFCTAPCGSHQHELCLTCVANSTQSWILGFSKLLLYYLPTHYLGTSLLIVYGWWVRKTRQRRSKQKEDEKVVERKETKPEEGRQLMHSSLGTCGVEESSSPSLRKALYCQLVESAKLCALYASCTSTLGTIVWVSQYVAS